MKLLFDQNLSPALALKIQSLFPGSSHTETEKLGQAPDVEIWAFARDRGFTIVSKDNDFGSLAMKHGAPPKAVWIRLGNCSTDDVEKALREDVESLFEFEKNPEASLILVTPKR